MLVTEEEAKTKRCQEGFAAATGISADGVPVMQVESSGPSHPHKAVGGYYAVSSGGAPMNCLGSACMAWRHLEAEVPPLYEEYATAANGVPPGAGWSLVCVNNRDRRWRREIRPAQPARGFCGKAGQLYRFD